ncbi:hypothetical protein JTB14_015599 [Gonioctena quinquepunctata]|nr:hypothetical protein JTB14_015599 [Gonioctena quinquepunctata]
MGNTESNVTSGVKKQAGASMQPIYKLCDLKDPHLYRHVCWKLKERGAVGETIMHLCLLNATSLHADIAKRLLKFYPKLINDIYISDEYYGENVLHIAIVNEDPSMVRFLLDANVNIHERCFGNFMCPEDQKSSRSDSLDHEWVNVCSQTNYDGYVYWGEYPLTFAACLGQEESFRLILSRGADPDAQDTNGNTILHLLVIYQRSEQFDMAYEVGSSLAIRNVLNLTPLTLAAKLARIDMFFHILNLEREIYWQIGSITCAAYPLSQIDTIDMETGHICKISALNLVVFGDKDEHLELMDGVLIDLLNAKWNTFVKFKFYRQFFTFAFYFLISLVAFTLRPGLPDATKVAKKDTNSSVHHLSNSTTNGTAVKSSSGVDTTTKTNLDKGNSDDDDYDMEEWWDNLREECRLMQLDSLEAKIRLSAEIAMTIGAFLYLAAAVREARFLGGRMFFENLKTSPSRVMFLFSCILMLLIPLLRLACLEEIEDTVAVMVMLTTAPYFLFFCRGFKTVGPFVVMIYRMVMGDLIRFASIYLVFVMGFSQAFYIIFLSFDNPLTPEEVDDSATNPMSTPIESIMAMFLMSMTNFGDYYDAFSRTEHEYEAKILFVIFMGIVAILLINMLIAMMGNTYQKIAETRNEWQRQWARIVLVVERGVSPPERHKQLMVYSQPMSDGKRALVLRLNQSDEDKEEMKEILEIKRRHERYVKKRKEKNQANKS